MTLVLDSGALIALEHGERAMWRRFKAALAREETPICHGGIVGQVWRARGPRQALLSMALSSIDVRGIDDVLGRAAGELLGIARKLDVIDAALVMLANDGDQIVTSDVEDIEALAAAAGTHVELVRT